MTRMKPGEIPQKSADASLNAAAFVRRHGAGLFDLLDALGLAEAADALCDLHAQANEALPDPRVAGSAVQRIVTELARPSFSDIDRVAGHARIDVDAALRWYGARLTDLLSAFPEQTARAA